MTLAMIRPRLGRECLWKRLASKCLVALAKLLGFVFVNEAELGRLSEYTYRCVRKVLSAFSNPLLRMSRPLLRGIRINSGPFPLHRRRLGTDFNRQDALAPSMGAHCHCEKAF